MLNKIICASAILIALSTASVAAEEVAKQKKNLMPDAVTRKNAPTVKSYCAVMPSGSIEVRMSSTADMSYACKIRCNLVRPDGKKHTFECGTNLHNSKDQYIVCQDPGPYKKVLGGDFACQ